METFHYNDCGMVMFGDKSYLVRNLSKACKTRSVTSDGWTRKINVSEMRIAPSTYWKISNHYDQQFEGHDANCWLCKWYGMDYSKCKCKKSGFTVEEHTANIPIVRRNFLKTLFDNYFPELKKDVDNWTDDQVNGLLYGTNKYGAHALMLDFPHWSSREKEVDKMNDYLSLKLEAF